MGTKEAFDEYFKFKTGDLVVARSPIEGELLAREMGQPEFGGPPKIPMPEVIIGRTFEECHGGIQGFYLVRRYTEAREILGKLSPSEVMGIDEMRAAYAPIIDEQKKRDSERSTVPGWRSVVSGLTSDIAAIKAQLEKGEK